MTIAGVARIIGISHQQFQRYETGDNTLSLYAVKLVADALGVPSSKICGCCEE